MNNHVHWQGTTYCLGEDKGIHQILARHYLLSGRRQAIHQILARHYLLSGRRQGYPSDTGKALPIVWVKTRLSIRYWQGTTYCLGEDKGIHQILARHYLLSGRRQGYPSDTGKALPIVWEKTRESIRYWQSTTYCLGEDEGIHQILARHYLFVWEKTRLSIRYTAE